MSSTNTTFWIIAEHGKEKLERKMDEVIKRLDKLETALDRVEKKLEKWRNVQ